MKRPSMFNLLPLPYLSLLLSVIYFLGPNVVDSALLQGCKLDNELCDENEACIPDGLFGQCYSDAASVSPLIIGEPLNEAQHEVLRAELVRLADNGLDWPDAISQCVLAYFKLSVAYDLAYDPNFCNVRNPTNVWALVQRVQTLLGEQPIVNANDVPSALLSEDSIAEEPAYDGIPIVVVGDDELPASELDALPEPIKQQNEKANNQTKNENVKRASNSTSNGDEKSSESDISEEEMSKIISQISELQNQMDYPELVVEESLEAPLSNDEQKELNQYVTAVLNDQASNIGELQPQQKRKLFMFVETLQNALDEEQLKPGSAPEIEEIVPLTSVANQQQLLLKKDTEKFNNADMGLANTVHKIVKGDIQRVEGNRVYLRVNQNEIREDEIYKLIAYLDKKIAEPNNLYFDEFAYDDGQLSFRVSRFDAPRPKEHKNEKRVDSASGVAQAVYKRRKDIQTLAGVEVDETGIGSGVDVVPVEKNERDWLFFPILFICAFTITTLISVLAVHLFKNRRRTFRENLPEVIDTLEGGKATFAYEELCRQRNRMSVQDGAVGIPSKTSSTSSWPDESLLQTSELDISTGHIILGFLTEHLERPEKIVEQWKSVENYVNTRGETTIATSAENTLKNRDQDVLPFDENVVTLQPANGDLTQGLQYINASKIHDSDLRHVAYIATQAPLQDTIAEFWQMVWEQGIALIVNLCTQDDIKNNKCDRYWPEEGAKAYGTYEIHLVSEHIWSEDYMVRSFYLKNLNTNETRTVTQFHYISWIENGVPASNKSLLEFRRKVNRSYRGKASPVLVHCSNGSDRTGTYILIDMVVNRIAKGIKELNIAGTVEFLRDQRMKCCQNIEQFKLVFSCVADEVTSLLKNLQH